MEVCYWIEKLCIGNTIKNNVGKQNISIQSRFCSFYFCFDGFNKGFTRECMSFVGVDDC